MSHIVHAYFFFQTKDERIAQLETENSMLYLKLAQLHGTVQTARQENASLNGQVESEQHFRSNVSETAFKLQRELEVHIYVYLPQLIAFLKIIIVKIFYLYFQLY